MERVLFENLSEDMVSFMDFIGEDMFVEICERFGGSQLYFPKKSSLLRASRNKKIKSMYGVYSRYEIARKFDLTEKQVDNIIRS